MADIPVAFELTDANGATLTDSLGNTLTLTTGYTATETPRSFTSLTPFDTLRIINEPLSDTPEVAVPSPVTWETDSPVGDVDWSFFTIAVDTTLQARGASSGAVLISPRYAIVADHTPGTGNYVWMTPGGVEVTRTAAASYNAFEASQPGADLRLIRLSSAINNIDPIPILEDSVESASRNCLVIEHDRHLNKYQVVGGQDNDSYSFDIRRTTGEDALEAGDSGKPAVVLIQGNPVLLMMIRGLSSAGGFDTADGANVSYFLAQLNAIMAADAEEVTVLRLTSVGGGFGAIRGALGGAIRHDSEEEEEEED